MASPKRRLNILELISAETVIARTQRGCTREGKHFYYTAKKEASKTIDAMVSYDTKYRGCACDVTSHVLSFVSVKKAAYVYCYCISSLWERLVAPSVARIVSRKEAA